MESIVTIDRWEIISAIASSISAVTSIVAIPFIAIQLRNNNRLAKAQLINELERDISLHAQVFDALSTGGKWHQSGVKFDRCDRIAILKYLSFYERVYIILKTGVLDLATIDDIFAGRFFYFWHNPNVRELIKDADISPYINSIHELSEQWYEYRKEHHLTIPLDDRTNKQI
jgi:hypothetical protein